MADSSREDIDYDTRSEASSSSLRSRSISSPSGFARLGSHSRRDVSPVNWILPPGISARALGGIFQIDWITKKELPFSKVSHLYNPWNDGKPVKIGRDGQEIEPKVAGELCRIFPEDESTELTPILYKSKRASKRVSRDPQMRTPAGTSSSPGTNSRQNDGSVGLGELPARRSIYERCSPYRDLPGHNLNVDEYYLSRRRRSPKIIGHLSGGRSYRFANYGDFHRHPVQFPHEVVIYLSYPRD
ncbi:unnamed protein product [Notodromas monacha]|uniref:YTH domain-containing protein n=1 Tax=Notodromas monacha TaxID=399045 RepID=A0A7R9GAK8_9CRUS|nr:unnamed protein product [Notodromas monacha]CAG0913852.1 unnamed protein product [Notodromas monacha]